MRKPPTSRAELVAEGATLICEVSSADEFTDTPIAWTELSLWWTEDEQRPFTAVVEGRVGPHAPQHYVDRFRSTLHGTLNRALGSFETSNLLYDLVEAIPADADSVFPDANALRQRSARRKRGYQGEETVIGVVRWLYGDGPSSTELARMVAADFGVPFRTAFNGITAATGSSGWAKAFVAAMRYFDRGAWKARGDRRVLATRDDGL